MPARTTTIAKWLVLALTALPLTVNTTINAEPLGSDLIEDFEATHPEFASSKTLTASPVTPQAMATGPDTDKRVALTFDACSTWGRADYDPRVIDILRETGTPATLFLGGLWMARHPEITRDLHEDRAFEIGNHGHAHRDMTTIDHVTMDRELGFTQLIAEALTGEQPRYFRAPYVRKNDQVVERAALFGLTTIQYDIASGDADPDADPQAISDYVTSQAEPGSIVVLHMNDPQLPTAKALPAIIDTLRDQGYTLVTVGELLDHHQ